MKFLGFDRVLALSPHPDDVEYGIAGSIMKFRETQFDLLCLTQGTSTDESRLFEVKKFWELLNLPNVNLIFSGIPAFEDKSQAQWITWIEGNTSFSESYQAILGTSAIDSHFEHHIVNGFMQALCRSACISIIEYKSPSSLHTWIPNLFVEITEVMDKKSNALRSTFLSQLDAPYFSDQAIRQFHSDFLNLKKGRKFNEAYRIITLYDK